MATITGIQFPWTSDGVSNALLDVAYHSFRSGDKLTSPMFEDWLVDGTLSEADFKTLLITVYTLYRHKWDRLYKLLKAEYNPIENYNGTETETTTTSNRENMGSLVRIRQPPTVRVVRTPKIACMPTLQHQRQLRVMRARAETSRTEQPHKARLTTP